MAVRRRRHEEHENHERWLVSYADFITLLFAFFTVLYATSQADLQKQEEFEKSFKSQINASMGFGFSSGASAGAGSEESGSSGNQAIRPPMEMFPPRGAGPGEVEDHVRRRLERDMSEEERGTTVANVRHDALGVRIEVAASKLFPSGSSDLRTASVEALDKLARVLKDSNRKIIIEGHTDDEPIRTPKFPSNWELAAARATKVVRYLITRHHLPASRLTAVAYADQKPVVPNTSEENRARNRRIEILIVTGGGAAL